MHPALSADGRWLAFASAAALTGLVPDGQFRIYLRDLRTGRVTPVTWQGLGGRGPAEIPPRPLVSADGRYVAFGSNVQLTEGIDNPTGSSSYVYDRRVGRLLAVPGSAPGSLHGTPRIGGLSDTSGLLLVTSTDPDLAPGPVPTGAGGRREQTYLFDIATRTYRRAVPRIPGVALRSYGVRFNLGGRGLLVTADAALNHDGKGGGTFARSLGGTTYKRIPHDRYGLALGRYALVQTDRALVPADTNRIADVYRYDRRTRTLARLSVTTDRRQCTRPRRPSIVPAGSFSPRQSADGRMVFFYSNCPELNRAQVPGDSFGLFVRDTVRRTTAPVDVTKAGRPAAGMGTGDGLDTGYDTTPDGRTVVFSAGNPLIWTTTPGATGPLYVFRRAGLY
jgi:hypothetical protein